jgi:hypothetical protein
MNRWTILKKVGVNHHRQTLVLCRCQCGTERVVIQASIKAGQSKSCGCLQREAAVKTITAVGYRQVGKLSPKWVNGKFQDTRGYVMAYSPGHPRAKTRNYVQEHTLVMEKMLGRYLFPHEVVHHRNGVRNDNRPENLELWSTHHPSGQRPLDLVTYAKEILALYDNKVTETI